MPSEAFDSLVANAADGFTINCTLSSLSVQIIFYAIGFLERKQMWKRDFSEQITDAEWDEIREALDNVSIDILP